MFDKRVLSAGILCMTLGLTGCPDASRTTQADRRAVGPAGRWAGVKLTLTERAGADRIDERVTTGVPLPQGLIKDASELSLLGPDGRPIPAETRPVLRWPDQSIKWVHLYFQADCKAKGQTSVTLTRGQAAKWTSKLKVADGDDAVTVTTGPLKFVVRKKGFNLIDAAWIDPTGEGQFDDAHQVIKPHGCGLVVQVGGKEFLGVHDKEVQVAVEEQGPMHVVIRAEGVHKNAAGEKMLDFVVRLYAYHDSPEVKVVHTFLNRQGKRADHVAVEGLHI